MGGAIQHNNKKKSAKLVRDNLNFVTAETYDNPTTPAATFSSAARYAKEGTKRSGRWRVPPALRAQRDSRKVSLEGRREA